MQKSVAPDEFSVEAAKPDAADGSAVTPSPLPPQPETSNQKPETYTKSQLALRNGQDRDEIWVAYRGLIYDVTRSRLWKRGNHYEHWAGQDLTQELDRDAPHTPNVFDKFTVIGRLA